MSDPKKAAILLPDNEPCDEAHTETLVAQFLACQLYAANHDLKIVGRCQSGPRPAATPPLAYRDLELVAPHTVNVVLTVAPDPDYAAHDEFSTLVERLRAEAIAEVVLIDEWTPRKTNL